MNLAETWRLLEEDSGIAGVSGRVQRRIMPAGRRNVFLGLEMPAGNRMLIPQGLGEFGCTANPTLPPPAA